jgi:hypothetical protein
LHIRLIGKVRAGNVPEVRAVAVDLDADSIRETDVSEAQVTIPVLEIGHFIFRMKPIEAADRRPPDPFKKRSFSVAMSVHQTAKPFSIPLVRVYRFTPFDSGRERKKPLRLRTTGNERRVLHDRIMMLPS